MLGRLLTKLGGEEDEKEELSDGARARQEVLRGLLKTPIQIGEEEYESLLGNVYEMARRLLPEAEEADEDSGVSRHRRPGARWDEMGFQAQAPDREFRGGGMLGLYCLAFALREAPEVCKDLLLGPFPFAAASINMTLVVARLCGVARPGTAEEDAVDPLAQVGEGSKSMASRCQHLLEDSHDGFFLVHCAALEALQRARSDVDAGPMDFAACAAAARDEVAVLLSHQPATGEALRELTHQVPKRVSGFLLILRAMPSNEATYNSDEDDDTTTPIQNRSSSFGSFFSPTTTRNNPISRKARFYVSLSTGTIKWYDQVHSHAGPSKNNRVAIPLAAPLGTLRLRPTMTVKFNRPHATLSVYALRDPLKPLFSAIAIDANDMERWCVALTEHVALGGALRKGGKLAKSQTQKATLADDALPIDQRYFKVVESVGIYVRSAPNVAATRTGHALMPGDLLYATRRLRVQDDSAGPRGRAFLRVILNHDISSTQTEPSAQQEHGYVMEHHPQTFEPIIIQVDPPNLHSSLRESPPGHQEEKSKTEK